MKYFLLTSIFVSVLMSSVAQNSFVDYQKSFGKVSDVFKRKEDTLKKQFAAKKLEWPAKHVYIRSFKYDSELEVWVKSKITDEFQLFKTYKICALAGTLGPKRIEGDYQVPEGFYYINEFKPNSTYHLSLGLNYPNAADKILADSISPGGDIYIHGSCVTQGCIPITNPQIEELYILTTLAKNNGQDFIPVHIFPVRFNNPKSLAYLERLMRDDAELREFEKTMKQAFDYFDVTKQLPIVSVNTKGEYVLY
ncbi:MAG TPA: L,D-transpeptidase family protein [Chitinophagaceae bacterium]|jgi:murein L,D-transpeptidase YafK|nr:L,D-transpeptidase family protein [Chitinophagaceae bacterium]